MDQHQQEEQTITNKETIMSATFYSTHKFNELINQHNATTATKLLVKRTIPTLSSALLKHPNS
jgi:hypothetical protein